MTIRNSHQLTVHDTWRFQLERDHVGSASSDQNGIGTTFDHPTYVMADNERPARVQEEMRWIREEVERTRAEARMRERAHEERRERQERQNQARAEELEAELQQQQWDFGRNLMRAMEQFRPRPVDPPVAIADNGVAAAAVGNEMAQRAAAALPLPPLPPGIPPMPAVWYPAPQPTLPKPTIEPLDTTTPEAYIEFQRAYKIIMKSRDRWNQRQRKQFLLENVRKEAAILCTGVEYDIDNDEVTWETVLGRLENTFLTRNNTAQAGTEFRAARQKKGEPITSWAARLRDLHLRAYARTHPDAEQRERHDELRSAFAKGLRDARVQLSLANQVSQVPTLLELVKIATDTEFHIAMSHPDSPVKGSVNEMEAEQTKQDQAEDGRICTLCEKIGHKWPGCPELKKEVAQKFADASLEAPPRFGGPSKEPVEAPRDRRSRDRNRRRDRSPRRDSSSGRDRSTRPDRRNQGSTKGRNSINAMDGKTEEEKQQLWEEILEHAQNRLLTKN